METRLLFFCKTSSNDCGISGSMASVNHIGLFPWCIPTISQNPAFSYHPVAVDLEKAMKWFWRVKSWRFVGTANFSGETVSQNQVILNNAIFDEGVYLQQQPQSERGIVCVKETVGVYNYTEPNQFSMYLFIDFFPTNSRTVYFGNQLYPQFAATISVDGVSCSTASDNENALQVGVATIDGVTCPLTLGEDVYVDFSASITITPEEYWPYDPEDGGGPIYDSATGARIRTDV